MRLTPIDRNRLPDSPADKSIVDSYQSRIDLHGLVQPNPGGSSGNGVRYTYGEYLLALIHHGCLTKSEFDRLYKLLSRLTMKNYPGIIMRTPNNAVGYQSLDDTRAALLGAWLLGHPYYKDFMKHGRENLADELDFKDLKHLEVSKKLWNVLEFFGATPVKFNYNNLYPKKFRAPSWMYRRFDVMILGYYSNDEEPPTWIKVAWAGSLVWGSTIGFKHQDGWIMDWESMHMISGRCWYIDLCYAVQVFALWIRHKEGIGGILKEHFGKRYGWHPSALALTGVFSVIRQK